MEVFPGITMNPDVRSGKPCLTGTRLDIATIVGFVLLGLVVGLLARLLVPSIAQRVR